MKKSVGRRARRIAVMLGVVAAVAAFSAGTAAAGPVLILNSSVTGGMASDEALAAIAAGKTVELASDAQWAAKTAAEFGAYDALILGDPTCTGGGGSATSIAAAEANRTTWSPTIDGNIVIIGTDEVFHSGQGGLQLTNSAVKFAGDAAGKTGLMASLSCYYHDSTGVTHNIPVLDQFGTFTSVGVDCYNDAHIVATHPALAGLTDASLSNWSCSVHEGFAAFPASFLTLAIAENITGPFSRTYPDGTFGVPYILARGEGLVPIGGGCGEVRGDGRLNTNPDFRFVFTSVKQEEGKAATGEHLLHRPEEPPREGEVRLDQDRQHPDLGRHGDDHRQRARQRRGRDLQGRREGRVSRHLLDRALERLQGVGQRHERTGRHGQALPAPDDDTDYTHARAAQPLETSRRKPLEAPLRRGLRLFRGRSEADNGGRVASRLEERSVRLPRLACWLLCAAFAALAPADARAIAAEDAAAVQDLTIVATGDLLIHQPVWDRALANGNGVYRFRPMFAAIRPTIRGADLALCHMETPLGPGRRGDPVFNTPPALAYAVKWAGGTRARRHRTTRSTRAAQACARRSSPSSARGCGTPGRRAAGGRRSGFCSWT